MQQLFQYTLAISVPLFVLWAVYRLALAGIKRPTANRATLIAVFVVSLTLFPLLKSTGILKPVILIVGAETSTAAASGSGWDIMSIASAVWAAGAAVCLIAGIAGLVRICMIVRRCTPSDHNGLRVYLHDDHRLTPFSIGRIIVMNRGDYQECGATIVMHEAGHIRRRHVIDLLLSQVFVVLCWYNPAAWLMRGELKAVHEYQADDYVLRSGCDARDYQLILLRKAVGAHLPDMVSNLSHSSIRHRISMMNRPVATPRSIWLYAMPLAGLACAAAVMMFSPLKNALSTPVVAMAAQTEPQQAAQGPKPEIFVEGNRMPYDEINSISPSDIKAISINRNDNRIDIDLR